MQRWIAAGVVAMILFLGGSYFAYRTYQQNRPHPVWVPLPINPELPSKERDAIMTDLKAKLRETERLVRVSRDLALPRKLKLPTDEQCAREVSARIFVRSGDADTPMGKVPAIHIGLNGKEKESALTGEIAMRLMDDVWKILGIKPPAKKGS